MDDNFIEDNLAEEPFLASAARIADEIETQEGYSEIISLIAVRSAESGLLDAAIQLAVGVNDPYIRDQALASIAAECVEFGEADYADELLGMIEDSGLYGAAMEQVAVKYAETGAFDRALEMAGEMDDSGQALSRIALAYFDSGDAAKALDAARSIEDAGLRANTLIELAARGFRSNHDSEAAEKLLIEAGRGAEEIEFSQERINSLLDVASLYKETGKEEEALEIVVSADRLCDSMEDEPYTGLPVTYARDETRALVATRFAQLGRFAEADAVIEKIEDPLQFASAAAGAAVEYKKAGQGEQAQTLLAEALDLAKEEVYGERTLIERDTLLASLAVSYAEVGRLDGALEVAKMVSVPNKQFAAWRDVGKAFARSNNHNGIFQVADLIQHAYGKVIYDIEMSEAEAGLGEEELAAGLLSQALKDAEAVEMPFEKSLALMEVGSRFAQRAQPEKASELLLQSLDAAAKIESNYQLARVLIQLDDKYRQAGLEPGEREESILQKIVP
ncbi:MAG: hypothetical protein M3362_19590 [Acidobacteriota bacterium]|nr:hypothetical protein [Acidobacteriota bacterium]